MPSILVTALLILLPLIKGSVIDFGKVYLKNALPNDPGCIDVSFNSLFQQNQDIRVMTSLSHSDRQRSVHDPAALWVKRISSRGFKACVRESGVGSNGTGMVNWLAVQGTYVGREQGVVSFDQWGSGTQCKTVRPQQSYSRPLQVFASVVTKDSSKSQDAMNVWVTKDIRGGTFSVCLRELNNFDGVHSQIKVNWIAYQEMPYTLNLTESNQVSIDSTSSSVQQVSYSFCKNVQFENEFYTPPVVVTTGSYHGNDSRPVNQDCNAMNVWIEEIAKTFFKVCARELNDGRTKDIVVNIDYVVNGDLDPCINVSCNYFAVCKAFAPRDARCVCVEDCPSYEEQVCSSNGTTFKNKCYYELEMCRLKSNHTVSHPGSCTGFPLERGRTSLSSTPVDGTLCKQVTFRPFAFYIDKRVHVHLTVNHFNTTNPDYVHDASASWVENVNYKGFTACLTIAGRSERARVVHATFDWFAYQGAPDGGVTDRTRMEEWWTGTKCETIELPQGKFQSVPTVIVTAEHISAAFKHDAANIWLENVNITSFQFCLRELQNFDGLHENIHVSWIAFEEIHRPLFSEIGKTFFPNTNKPSMRYNGAFCKDLKYSKIYDHVPTVILSTNHTTTSEISRPEYNGVATWIEYMNTTGFRVCVKELYTTKYEPLTVNFLVLSEICHPGWNYFDGVCYNTSSSCDTWIGSEYRCRSSRAHLATIQSQRQNVYIQQRLNGAKGWIGLNDTSVEGVFGWTSGMQMNWTYWADKQPNNAGDQDCVHTLGVGHQYQWDDVSCNECHNFTCEKDLNECSKDAHSCRADGAVCRNTFGSYYCQCKTGYLGNGQKCTDIDECANVSRCDVNATCTNTPGSFICQCNKGFSGDGFSCTDIDECSGSEGCPSNVTCINTVGSFTCQCKNGFTWNGRVCADLKRHCKDIYNSGERRNGVYTVKPNSQGTFQVYCDMTADGGGWTMISRFSNSDAKNWMRDDGYWWYVLTTAQGSTTSTSVNQDMISPAFWSVTGSEIKITRSDDSFHTALLRTTSNCLGSRTFRSKVISYGNFQNGKVWASDQCRGSCSVVYGGQYTSTHGFSQARCSSNIQSSNKIGFWCAWSSGDGAVLMIGGGGSSCARADHGIGITEEDSADFSTTEVECDFGDVVNEGSGTCPTSHYALNLWIR